MAKRVFAVIMAFVIGIALIVLIISSSSDDLPVPSSINGNKVEVTWIAINSPPGQDGPCYAYFSKRSEMQEGYGYSGVWCK